MNAVTGVLLQVDGDTLISDTNKNQYRQESRQPYTLNLPENDISGYRDYYSNPQYLGWLERPYTQGVQDGIWVQLDDLSIGTHTIHFQGTLNLAEIDVVDYNASGSIDIPVEALLELLNSYGAALSLNVTYNVEVVSRPEFNAQIAAW